MPTHGKNAPMGAPKPYKRPELRKYGALTNLVQGVSGMLGDGAAGMTRL